MSVLVDSNTRVLIQGITGRTGRLYVERMAVGGTKVVGGVTPGKGGTEVEGVPVFDSVDEAQRSLDANAILSCVGANYALDALFEAADAKIPLAVIYIEDIPVHDAILMRAYAKANGVRLLGPNSAGVVTPGQCNLSDLNDAYLAPGRIGIVSKSGTLTYEVISALSDIDLGISTVVCLGGDRVIGTSYVDILRLFDADPATDLVVIVGEPGGGLEHEAAAFAKSMSTPVVAYITGQHAPPAARMGHAGAVVGEDLRSRPASKVASFEEAGCLVAKLVTEINPLVLQALPVT